MFKILKWKKLWIEQIANKSAWEQTNGENELTYLRIRDGIFFFSGWFPVHVLEDPDDEAVDSLLDVWRGVEPFATCSIQAGIHSSSTPSQPFAMEFQGQFPRDMGFCTAQMKAGRRGFDESAFRLEWKTERTARTAPLPFTHPKDYLHHQFLTAPENEIIQRRKISRPLSKGYPILLIFCFIHVFTCI